MDRSKSLKDKGCDSGLRRSLCYPPTAENWERMANLFRMIPDLFRKLWGRDRLLYDRGESLLRSLLVGNRKGDWHETGAGAAQNS